MNNDFKNKEAEADILQIISENLEAIVKGNIDLDSDLVPAFYSTRPTSVRVMDKPGSKIRKIPTEQFEKERHVTWSASPWIHRSRKLRILSDQTLMFNHINILFEHLFFREPNVVICYKNPHIGSGLLANQDFKKGEIVGSYSGIVTSATSGEASFKPTGLVCDLPSQMASGYSKHYGKAFYTADAVLGYSAFIQHAPNNQSLMKLQVSEEVRKKIATSNLLLVADVHLNVPVFLLIAMRDIKNGEELFYDYEKYWEMSRLYGASDGSYGLFDRISNVMGTAHCDGSVALDPNYPLKKAKPALRCVDDNVTDFRAVEDRLNENTGKYLKENIRHVVKQARVLAGDNFQSVFEGFEKCLMETIPTRMFNQLLKALEEHHVDDIPELQLFRLEMDLYLNLFKTVADHLVQASCVQSSFVYQLNQQAHSVIDLIKTKLFELTNLQWKCSALKEVYFCSGDQLILSSIKRHFEKYHILSKESGADAKGQYFLIYHVKDITLESLSKISAHPLMDQSVADTRTLK